jgi:hypothetical protein
MKSKQTGMLAYFKNVNTNSCDVESSKCMIFGLKHDRKRLSCENMKEYLSFEFELIWHLDNTVYLMGFLLVKFYFYF